MSDRRRRLTGSGAVSGRSVVPWRGFTLAEVVIAVALFTVVLAIVALLGRHFLVTFIWGEQTMSMVHEASVLHASLRRDFMRVGLSGSGKRLSIELLPRKLVLVQQGNAGERIEYSYDPQTRGIWRRSSAGVAQPLATGMVRRFVLSRVFLRRLPGPRFELVETLPPAERPFKAGVRIRLGIQGQESSGTNTTRAVEFSTHFFPPFANLRLASVWKEP